MREKATYFAIFAACFSAILLEIAYTRIFSFKVYYYFTYFIIGVALLGLGAGGVCVAISRRLRTSDPPRAIATSCTAGAAAVLLGYLVIAPLPLHVSDLFNGVAEPLKLLLVSLLLFAPFFSVGIVVALVLSADPPRANRRYAADLVGAALACTLAVSLLEALTPPGCVMLAGLTLAAAGLPLATAREKPQLGALAVTAVALAIALVARASLPDPVADRLKHVAQYRAANLVRYSKWHPVFRVDVVDHAMRPGSLYGIVHDGQLGTGIHPFDGDFSKLEHFREDPRSYPFSVAPSEPRVLIIGSAGGYEVLASLFFGASRVTGVELNPVTVWLLTERYADFAGRIHEDERVAFVVGEGRSFLKRTDAEFDLIWLVAPDSYAAMNASSSAAFVLSESYLYTVEMIRESLDHLASDGILCVQFGELDYTEKPNRTARYVSTARRALQLDGFEGPSQHLLVATSTDIPPFVLSTVLVGKAPFDRERVGRFLDNSAFVKGGVNRFAPGEELEDGPVNQVASLPAGALADWYRSYRYDVTPVADDSPFFWHFSRFRDVMSAPTAAGGLIDWEDAIGERVLLALLVLVVFLGGVFLLLPFAAIRPVFSAIPYRAAAFVYFAALGIGFMLLEISLIQMLTLFLGYPTRSLSVALFGLLLFAGIGSLASGAYAARRNRALALLLVVLTALIVFYQFGLPAVVDRFAGAPLALRVGLAVCLMAPLGLCLGAFLPLGLRSVASATPHSREVVAWGWAVNGFFSVLSSILAVVLAMSVGFRVVLLIALASYAVGVAALTRIPEPPEAR